MRYNDELALIAELPDHIRELAYVRIIERRIHFVQYTERRWLDQIDSK